MLVFREGAAPIDPAAAHRDAPVADLHAHPGLTAHWLKRDLAREHRPPVHGYNPLRQQLDLPRMLQGGLRVLTACAYVPTVPPFPSPFRGALGSMRFVEELCAREPRKAQIAARGQVRAVLGSGRLAVLHAAEGGHHIEGSLERLEELAARGLRYLTLTHFIHNKLAQPAKLGPFTLLRGPPGLTELGRRVVKKCEALGVLVDLTHCSDRSFAGCGRTGRRVTTPPKISPGSLRRCRVASAARPPCRTTAHMRSRGGARPNSRLSNGRAIACRRFRLCTCTAAGTARWCRRSAPRPALTFARGAGPR